MTMARVHDMPYGEVYDFHRRLHGQLDPQMVRRLNSDDELLSWWVGALREKLTPPAPTFDRLFRSPEQVFKTFKAWNLSRRRSGLESFTDEQVDELERTMPTKFVSTLQAALSLRIRLRGTLAANAKAHWNWVRSVHERSEKWDGVLLDDEHLRLLGGQTYDDSQSSVEWVIVDLTANRGKDPATVRGLQSAGFEVMVIFAVHPDLPQAIDYEDIPGFWLAAFEVSVPGGDPWRHVPFLGWHRVDRTVLLHAYWDDSAGPIYSVPVSRELEF